MRKMCIRDRHAAVCFAVVKQNAVAVLITVGAQRINKTVNLFRLLGCNPVSYTHLAQRLLAGVDYVCEMPADDVNKRRAIINIFVQSIYLYDDHLTLIINASKKPLSIDLSLIHISLVMSRIC